MRTDKSIKRKLSKLESKREKVNDKFQMYETQLTEIDNKIEYFKSILNIKPQILFNQGRDKKYVYGQVYYLVEPTSDRKKSFRFLIGKMSEKKTRKEWEELCVDVFYYKIGE